MNTFLRTLKNWWVGILGALLIVLDQGFEVINPLLVEIGIPSKWIGILKLIFGVYGIYRLKKSLPTQNKEKLENIVASIPSGPGGSNPPPGKDDK